MRVLSVVHHRNAAAGVFREPARVAGHELVEWVPHEGPPPSPDGLDAAIVFGAEAQVDQEEMLPWLRHEKELVRLLLERDVPLLGVCFGSQVLAEAASAVVRPAKRAEIGWNEVEVTGEGAGDPVIGTLAPGFTAFQWHSYEAVPPDGAVVLARTPVCPQAFRIGERAWGIQFHAEVTAADVAKWIADYRSDEDAVRIGIDPEALREETERKIAEWNRLGRELCGRFLDAIT